MGRNDFFVMAVLAATVFPTAAAPSASQGRLIAASISPVHSLVAGVLGDRGPPVLLLSARESEHATVLKPSTAGAISEAALIFRVAHGFESALDKPIASLAKAPVIELAKSPGLHLLGTRALDEDHAPEMSGQPGDLYLWADLHIWLDPTAAKAMTIEIARRLSAIDPEGAAVYGANAERQAARLDELDREVAAEVAPVAAIPFVVFHDAYQYFVVRYGLKEVGRVEISPERAPSGRHLAELRAKIRASGAVCVFAEPQIEPRILPTLIEGLNVRTGVLDVLGVDLKPGPDLYGDMLMGLARSLKACLKP
ncbi:MAG: zinc ABC transporter substrate-binding protein [Alphaproteobacteria bacterium]